MFDPGIQRGGADPSAGDGVSDFTASVPSSKDCLGTTKSYLTYLEAQRTGGHTLHLDDVSTLLSSLKQEGLTEERLASKQNREAVREVSTTIAQYILPSLAPDDRISAQDMMSDLSRHPYWRQLMVHLGVGAELAGPNKFRERSEEYDPYDDLRDSVSRLHSGEWIVMLDQIAALVSNHEDLLSYLALDGTRPALEHLRSLLKVGGEKYQREYEMVNDAIIQAGPDDF